LDLQQLLPANQSYVSYAGSLTTPPCTERVLWIMMLNTQKMSLQQVR
jgi:carbonic anhydrase